MVGHYVQGGYTEVERTKTFGEKIEQEQALKRDRKK